MSGVAPPPPPVLSASEAAAWDSLARTQYRIPSRVLMEAAGRACAAVLVREFPDVVTRGALVAAGAGNNGGDGWVLARALRAAGVPVCVAALDPKTDDAIDNRALARVDGVREVGRDEPWPAAAVAVDALLGTGAAGPARGDVLALAERLVAYAGDQRTPIFAVDGPTGLDLSSGEAHGPVRARVTATFGGPRRGHLLARDWCGRVIVLDIGFPPPDPAWPVLVTDGWAAARLPRLQATMHKGDRGRVTVVGGSAGMTGAALHAARAALAAGAGLVKLVASPAAIEAARANLPDLLTVESALGPDLEPAAAEALEWADAVVLGPGLGRDATRSKFLAAALERRPVPTVLDADALVLYAGGSGADRPLVCTPHLGEFRALAGDALADEAANDRWAAAAKAALKLRATVLLKGVPTVVADLRGPMHVVASGNPGLATGGSGDLLAGFVGAFLARGTPPPEAAALGAHALGRAAELGARQWTARSLRPADVLAAMPDVWRAWKAPTPDGPPIIALLDPPESA